MDAACGGQPICALLPAAGMQPGALPGAGRAAHSPAAPPVEACGEELDSWGPLGSQCALPKGALPTPMGPVCGGWITVRNGSGEVVSD